MVASFIWNPLNARCSLACSFSFDGGRSRWCGSDKSETEPKPPPKEGASHMDRGRRFKSLVPGSGDSDQEISWEFLWRNIYGEDESFGRERDAGPA